MFIYKIKENSLTQIDNQLHHLTINFLENKLITSICISTNNLSVASLHTISMKVTFVSANRQALVSS